MNTENLTTGGDTNPKLISRIRLILLSYSKKSLTETDVEEIEEATNNFGTPAMIEPNLAYVKFNARLEKRKANVKRLVLVTACIVMFTMGVVAFANVTGWFNRIFSTNTINYGTTINLQESDSNFKRYDNLDTLLQDTQLQMPMLTTLPDELAPMNIIMEEFSDITVINIMYSSNEQEKYVRVTYTYYKMPNNSERVSSVNETYDYLGDFSLWGDDVSVYTDGERRIAYWNYEKFVVKFESNYSKDQLQKIIQNIK